MKLSRTFLILSTVIVAAHSAVAQPKRIPRYPFGLALEPPAVHQPAISADAATGRPTLQRSIVYLPQAAGDYWDSMFYDHLSYFDGIDHARVNAIVADTNFVYVAGCFQRFDFQNVWHIIAYDKHTNAWTPLADGLGPSVMALALHNGKLYAGGRFKSDGGSGSTSLQGIAVWDGSSWTEVGGGVDATVNAIALLGDDLIVGGNFSSAGGSATPYIARWNGSTWDDLSATFNSPVTTLLTRHDTLYVGGDFWDYTSGRNSIAMYTEAGGWQPLAQGLDGTVDALTFFHDSLWVGGSFWHTADGNQDIFGLASWDGSQWRTFGPDSSLGCGHGSISAFTVCGDSLVIGGQYSAIAGVASHALSIYSHGAFSAVANGVNGEIHALAKVDTSLVVGGSFGSPSIFNDAEHLANFNLRSGDWSSSFGTLTGPYGGYNYTATYATIANDRSVFVGGEFTDIALQPMNHIAVFDKASRTWSALGGGLDGNVWSLQLVGSKLYAGGEFMHADGIPATHVACYDLETKRWTPLGAGSNRIVYAMENDGTNLYVANELAHEGNSFNTYIGKWDGSSWTRIDHPLVGWVNALYLKGSNLYVGGTIYTADGTDVNNIVMYDGNSWQQVGDGLNDRPLSIVSIGNDLYATGWFTASNSTRLNGIGRWDGSSWHPLGTGLNYTGYALSARGADLYVGGAFTKAGGANFSALARWDGTRWSSALGGADYSVYGLANDGASLYVAGGFSDVNSTFPSYRFAILHFGDAAVGESKSSPTLSISNYPNPSSVVTNIEYTVPQSSMVEISLIDLVGRTVQIPLSEYKTQGTYTTTIDVSSLPSGIYLCRFHAGNTEQTQTITVAR